MSCWLTAITAGSGRSFYLMEKGLDCPVRFDVAEVYTNGAHSPAATHIEYIENAF